MPDLTRAEVEQMRKQWETWPQVSVLCDAWLTLEARVREQDREIQALRGSEEYEREIRIQTSKEQHALKKRVWELEEELAHNKKDLDADPRYAFWFGKDKETRD